MKKHPIKTLITRGESKHLDFKFEISDAVKIARSFVAFANADGGTLLIGVKDNGKIAGIGSEEEIFMANKAAHHFSSPPVHFFSKEWMVEGKKILEINIPRSEQKPHFVLESDTSKIAYHRDEDSNIVADPVWIRMQEKKNSEKSISIQYTDIEKELLSYLGENDKVNFDTLSNTLFLEEEDLVEILSDFWSIKVIEGERIDDTIFYSIIV